METANSRTVTVFGGTGFLGRRIVRHLRHCEFRVRIASRHPGQGQKLFGLDDPQLQFIQGNIHDERSVADALAGAYGVVNAVSLYAEHGQEDVAEAIGRIMQRAETPSTIFEFGGPRVYSYEEFLRAVAHQAGLVPLLIPIPFAAWHTLTWASEIFPSPLLTRNQVELMQIDTVSSPEMPGFFELGISPRSVETTLQKMLSKCG